MLKKYLSNWSCIINPDVIVSVLCGVTLLFSSCEEKIEGGGRRSDKMVPISFTLGDTEFRNGGDIMSRRGNDDGTPETVVIPIGNGLCMVATIEPDRDIQTRADVSTMEDGDPETDHEIQTRTNTSTLDNGVIVRIVAYRDGTTYETHADYTVDGFDLTSSSPLEVPLGNYKFVAYSYNTPTLPAHHNTTIPDIDPSVDLLWGCYPATGWHSVMGPDEVSILMRHQFSRVKLEISSTMVDTGINIVAIDTVSISPVSKKVNLSIIDSVLTATSDSTQCFLSWTGLNTQTATSESRILYTNNAETFYLNFKTITLDGVYLATPFPVSTGTFSKQLQRGTSYTLKLNIKKQSDITKKNFSNP